MRLMATALSVLLLAGCSDRNGNQALGTLERDRIVLKATANEIILSEPVPEGTMVSAGTLLVQLDDRQQQAVVSRARAEVAQATARLEELRNGARPEEIAAASARVEGARAEVTETEASYERAKDLLAQKLAAQATLDRALRIAMRQRPRWIQPVKTCCVSPTAPDRNNWTRVRPHCRQLKRNWHWNCTDCQS